MNTYILRKIGLSQNEITLYTTLLNKGPATAYELSKYTGIYRVHVYDKLQNLISKGLVTHVYKAAKKYFQASAPDKIIEYLEDKKRQIENDKEEAKKIIPELKKLMITPKEDTHVEVFEGLEGLKYFLRDVIKTRKEVLITGIEDEKYKEHLGIAMLQYFRDCKKYNIKERVITSNKNIFYFDKKTAPTSEYRFLTENLFNPTNTFVYGNKIVIITWETPVTAIMIENKNIADTYRNHFEYLWKIAIP